jgi:hypothetical protein
MGHLRKELRHERPWIAPEPGSAEFRIKCRKPGKTGLWLLRAAMTTETSFIASVALAIAYSRL